MNVRTAGISLLTAMGATLALDAALYRDDIGCSLEFVEGVQHETLFVYAPGMLCPAADSSSELISLWRQYGDVLLVDYGDGDSHHWDAFDSNEVVRSVAAKLQFSNLRVYDRTVLIGASLGGFVTHDLAARCREMEFDWIPVCAPMHGSMDIHPPMRYLTPLTRVLRPGPILNRLNLLRRVAVQPKPENVEPDVDWSELLRFVAKCYDYRLSFYRDQVAYAVRRVGFRPLDNIKRVVAIGGHELDDLVTADAADRIVDKYGERAILLRGNVGHVAFREQPHAWWTLFQTAFDQLGLTT